MVNSPDNSTKTHSNTSDNSYLCSHSWSVEARVFHIIDASEIELRPAEIARKLHAHKSQHLVNMHLYGYFAENS